ncbi:ATP-binding cassette domain-containing protein [Streptomyces spectabilis]|uniref:UvrABC system protein A n=1 Tax=Streptomyces spectabilis TaxID=68270 RepID=A0A5P2XNK1_STRST|nr:excinuclease ABC subunit UvrA [Streptomyces spectabilis]MBB5102364.1 excinuclease UvrABC ATPase subunit [Streptomyces spectabilis]MCI3907411.1 excinuclease ABC subunit UvrA [Streptomyces spectabilis]QEV64126.1 excinuclease ABC subunit UvrA [Streptomyces spectabilis]GGV30356.1 excinuclease ABC subunit A [Streptomyces spectabilis]
MNVTPADSHSVIQVRGARENNLQDVSLDLPKRRLTVFTGVSGSGKSSLVFGTIAAESQRLINETYAAFIQSFMPNVGRPDVDELRNLSAAIVVDQERMGANSRSTVGTATDAYTMLRIIFSRLGRPGIGTAGAFSFNVPEGMCPDCEGAGEVATVDVDQLVDRDLSLKEGAIVVPYYAVDSWSWQIMVNSGFHDPDKKLRDFTAREWDDLLHKGPVKVKVGSNGFTYEGLVSKMQRSWLAKDRESLQPHIRSFVERAVVFTRCPLCEGTRLTRAALASKVGGLNIAECSAMQISDLAAFVRGIDAPGVAPLLAGLRDLLDSLVEIGLGYLSLDRPSGTLSGGEAQRVKMVRHLGSSITDVTYVFDEPTIGLHPHDIQRMNGLLLRLRDKGNTVLVVEHKPEVVAIADHVVDLGPGAGEAGGRICYTGDVPGLRTSGTLTGRHLGHRAELRGSVRTPQGHLSIKGADRHNLKDVAVDVPLGVLTVVTGVAGSGKSSLIHGYLSGQDGVVVADQSPIRGSRRSNPATYTNLLGPIRTAFAQANGVKAALFSANSEGACPKCNGIGLVHTDLGMMAQVASVCEECAGKRFTPEVLTYTLRGKNISEVLGMSVAEAHDFFPSGKAHTILGRLTDVGLSYLRLGQPLNTLSGGERQRLKLAIHMAEKSSTYVLDEPTTGLHLADVDKLLALLDRLVDDGNSVVVIEHHQAVMAHADWIIDLGPGGGHDGGEVVFTGTPAELVEGGSTLTARHLREYVAS